MVAHHRAHNKNLLGDSFDSSLSPHMHSQNQKPGCGNQPQRAWRGCFTSQRPRQVRVERSAVVQVVHCLSLSYILLVFSMYMIWTRWSVSLHCTVLTTLRVRFYDVERAKGFAEYSRCCMSWVVLQYLQCCLHQILFLCGVVNYTAEFFSGMIPPSFLE